MMNRFIFGFQRRVWCPKWTPLSSSWRMVTTAMVVLPDLPWLSRSSNDERPGAWSPATVGPDIIGTREGRRRRPARQEQRSGGRRAREVDRVGGRRDQAYANPIFGKPRPFPGLPPSGDGQACGQEQDQTDW